MSHYFFYREDNGFTMLCWFLQYKTESATGTHLSSPS